MARNRRMIRILNPIDLDRERWAIVEQFRDAHSRPWRGPVEIDSTKMRATHHCGRVT